MTTTAHEDQFTPAPVEVTQGDREAAETWLMASRGFSVKIKPSHSLAQAFARHRIAHPAPPADLVEAAGAALHELDAVILLVLHDTTRTEMQAVADRLRSTLAKHGGA